MKYGSGTCINSFIIKALRVDLLDTFDGVEVTFVVPLNN